MSGRSRPAGPGRRSWPCGRLAVVSRALVGENPTGTVSFLFTDVEGSTTRWQHDDGSMARALAAHDHTIRSAAERHSGRVFKHTGDGMCAVFVSAPSAVAAAVEAQAGLELPVRTGVHTGCRSSPARSSPETPPTKAPHRQTRPVTSSTPGRTPAAARTGSRRRPWYSKQP